RGGMVGAFPGSVEGEMSLNVSRTQQGSQQVNGNAVVMAGEADGLYPAGLLIFPLQTQQLQEAHLLKFNGIAGDAMVQHDTLWAASKKVHSPLYLFLGGHAGGDVYLSLIFVAQEGEHCQVVVASGRNLDERRPERGDFTGAGQVPHG